MFFAGFLDVSNDLDDLKQGTKLEFPIWLSHPLNIIQGSLLNIELPKVYKDSYRFVHLYQRKRERE